MQAPNYLNKGSKIALVAPARKIIPEEIESAVAWLNEKGFVPVYDARLFESCNQYAGDDAFRAAVFQEYLDMPDIEAIWFVRGGYGGLHIVDGLDFTRFKQHPKWIVGYSDSTVFHGKMQSLGFQSLHATMPLSWNDNSNIAKESLFKALTGAPLHYEWEGFHLNRCGTVEAEMKGGNLSVLYSLLGSDTFPSLDGSILFLEDLDEYLYHIDRMILALKRAGKFSHLAALAIGSMTQMHDNTIPFGKTVEEIIMEHVKQYGYPVCFNVPAGHIADNFALPFGKKMRLDITSDSVILDA